MSPKPEGGDHVVSVMHNGEVEKGDKPKGHNDEKDKNNKICGKNWWKRCVSYGTEPWHILPYHPSVYKSNKAQLLNEVAAGVTVAFAQVSDSVAFAFIAGVGPLLGLHAAWIIGLSLAIFGSRPAMINGATGVRAAVIAPYVAQYGTGYLFYIVLMISVYQLLGGILKLAKYVRLVPRSVMIGFVNGLSIIFAKGQSFTFLDRPNPNVEGYNASAVKVEDLQYIQDGSKLGFMVMHIIIVILTIVLTPRIPKIGKRIPASLLGIAIVTFIEWVILRKVGYETPSIGEVSTVHGGLPLPFWQDPTYTNTTDKLQKLAPLNVETFQRVAFPAFIAAAAGAVEAVMTMEFVNDVTETTNNRPNQQLIALSIGNFLSGIFGTMGGGATIGMSVVCCTSGANGRFRISGIVAGLTILIFILVASPFIDLMPTASLVGVMAMVIVRTFDWESIPIILTTFLPMKIRNCIDSTSISCFGREISFSGMRKIKRTDAITIILVTVVTVYKDLFVAVALGIVFTSAAYAWEIGNDIAVSSVENRDSSGNITKKIYKLHGPLFFASAQRFVTLFNPKTDPSLIEIHFIENDAFINDHSAIHALNVIGEKYKKYNKKVVVKHLELKSRKLTGKASKLIRHFSIEMDDIEHRNGEVNPTFDVNEKEDIVIDKTTVARKDSHGYGYAI